jgi:hydrogenase nickel incorporation protein HypA/HybF
MSLAQTVIEEVVRQAQAHRMQKVDRVVLRIGLLRGVVEEAMLWALQACSKNTVAGSAEFEIDYVEAEAKCRKCGEKFRPDEMLFACPLCGQADADIKSGMELIIDSMEGEIPGEDTGCSRCPESQ